jgi:hypothetical protein
VWAGVSVHSSRRKTKHYLPIQIANISKYLICVSQGAPSLAYKQVVELHVLLFGCTECMICCCCLLDVTKSGHSSCTAPARCCYSGRGLWEWIWSVISGMVPGSLGTGARCSGYWTLRQGRLAVICFTLITSRPNPWKAKSSILAASVYRQVPDNLPWYG